MSQSNIFNSVPGINKAAEPAPFSIGPDSNGPGTSSPSAEYPVSLVINSDASVSMDDVDYREQREGTADALLSMKEDILDMAERGTPAIITYTEHGLADPSNPMYGIAEVRIPPTELRTEADIDQLSYQIRTMERTGEPGTTLTSEAMQLGREIHSQVEQEYGQLSRKVTDISADGFGSSRFGETIEDRLSSSKNQAEHQRVLAERQAAMNEGIEINGIVIPDYDFDVGSALQANDPQALEMLESGGEFTVEELLQLRQERPELFQGEGTSLDINRQYFEESVVTGFTLEKTESETYADFMERKLRQELLGSNERSPELQNGPESESARDHSAADPSLTGPEGVLPSYFGSEYATMAGDNGLLNGMVEGPTSHNGLITVSPSMVEEVQRAAANEERAPSSDPALQTSAPSMTVKNFAA